MIAAAYIRVSTEDQVEFSPHSQRKKIMEYAEHNGIQVPEEYVFIDEGISGRRADTRPAFQNMIALARSRRPFQKILVWKFSRFARNRQDSIFYKSMLRRDCGIEVISITEPLTHDPTSILIEALLEAMDEYYSINLAQEVRRGMQERFSRGKAISVPPFGYQMGPEGFRIHPVQSIWIPVIFEDYAAGKTPREIADRLNASHIRTTRGNLFQPRNINYILHNPVYIGKLRKRRVTAEPAPYGTQPLRYDRNYEYTSMDMIEGNHPPLIPLPLWNQVQERHREEALLLGRLQPSVIDGESSLADGETSLAGEKSSAFMTNLSPKEYFLKGLVFCSHCGGSLVHIHKGTAFQCSNYNHGSCHESHYVKTVVLEEMVMDALASLFPSSPLLPFLYSGRTNQEKNEILHQITDKIIYNKEKKEVELHLLTKEN